MITKKLSMFIAPVLILGLAACNNDNDTAMNTRNNNRVNTMSSRGLTDNNLYRVNYNTMDHQGPLTENYTNNNVRTNNGRTNWNRTVRNDNNPNPNISSYNTTKSSNSYPQTRAILIQEAKYQYVPINQAQGWELRSRNQNRQTAQAPVPLEQQNSQTQQRQTAQAPTNASQAVQQVIDLTNAQRRQNGLPDLKADTQLNSVAQKKSDDMQQHGYFSHTSPTYGSPFDMMRDFGVTYRSAGENIAQGQRTPQEVVQSWMNSEGHRRNILSRDFTNIGVGFDQTGYHWTQMFIGK